MRLVVLSLLSLLTFNAGAEAQWGNYLGGGPFTDTGVSVVPAQTVVEAVTFNTGTFPNCPSAFCAGRIALSAFSSSTDLLTTNQRVASAFGALASVDSNGLLTAPSYSIQGSTYNNVGGALSALNTQVSTNALSNGTTYLQSNSTGSGAKATGTNSLALGSNAQASNTGSIAVGLNSSSTGANSIAIGNGSVANVSNTVSVGSVGNERRITNVAPGVASTDAATYGQLQNISSGFENQVNGLQSQININQTEARRGIAANAALTSATPPSAPGKTTVSLTSGFFHGETGVGIAVAHRLRTAAPVIIYGGYANSGGENVGRVGRSKIAER